jgi:hypothetical protein
MLAFLGGLGLAGLASTVLIGAVGLAVAVAAVVAILVVRHRRTSWAMSEDAPVSVAAPTRRPSTP